MANFLNQDITIIDLPARWVGHDIHVTELPRDQYYSSWETFQPSHLPEIQIWLVVGYSRLIESRKKNEGLQHQLTRWRCEILRGWTTIASSKTWAGSATTCEHAVPDKHDHIVVLQENTTELWLGTIIKITKSCACPSGPFRSSAWTSFLWTNQSVAWCARKYRWDGGS